MTRHVPRRLRKSTRPLWMLKTTAPITAEQAHRIKQAWRTAEVRGGGIVIDGTHLTVSRLR